MIGSARRRSGRVFLGQTRRRRLTLPALLAVTMLVAAACGSGNASSGGGSGGTVKLGYIGSLSGPLAQTGQDMLMGAKVAVQQVNANGGVNGGKKLELVTKDDKLTPAAGATAARDLAHSNVKLMFGMLSSSICLAVAPVVQSLGGLTIGTACSSNPLVGPKRAVKNYWSTAITNSVSCAALSKVIAMQYPDLKTIDIFGYDYITGHEIATQCVNGMKANGLSLSVRKSYFVPLTSQTYTAQISALAQSLTGPSKGRGLFIVTYGAGTTAFLKQSAPYHLTDKYETVITSGGYVSSGYSLNGAAPKVWDAYEYFPTVSNSPQNEQFVQQYKALKPADGFPNDWSYEGYMSVMAYAKAVDTAKSTDPGAVATAMDKITFTGPLGPVRFDPQTHETTTPVLIFQTVGDASSDTKLKVLKWYLVNQKTNQISSSGP